MSIGAYAGTCFFSSATAGLGPGVLFPCRSSLRVGGDPLGSARFSLVSPFPCAFPGPRFVGGNPFTAVDPFPSRSSPFFATPHVPVDAVTAVRCVAASAAASRRGTASTLSAAG